MLKFYINVLKGNIYIGFVFTQYFMYITNIFNFQKEISIFAIIIKFEIKSTY